MAIALIVAVEESAPRRAVAGAVSTYTAHYVDGGAMGSNDCSWADLSLSHPAASQ